MRLVHLWHLWLVKRGMPQITNRAFRIPFIKRLRAFRRARLENDDLWLKRKRLRIPKSSPRDAREASYDADELLVLRF